MRLYDLLLHLYPASYRAEYGEELRAVFAERARDIAGPLAPVRRAFAAVADVWPNAFAVQADVLRRDLGYAARTLRRAPGFALAAVLVVALGVGANAAAFSVADFVLVRPLPFPRPDRLVRVWEATPGYGQMEFSAANYRDWKAASSSYSALGAYFDNDYNLSGTGEPRRISAVLVSPELIGLLGVQPLIGRAFEASDYDGRAVAVLSYALWQSELGGDPAVVGRTVRLDDRAYEVVGVMPADFSFPDRRTMLWLPLVLHEEDYGDRADNYLYVVGRLRNGVSVERARAEMVAIAARSARQFPKENHETSARVVRLSESISQRARLLLLALCGASLCILLLACANLANLLLARAMGREREIAVRAALGAGRERLVRQLVTESVALVLLGGVAGVLVAIVAMPLLGALVPTSLPIAQQPRLDPRVLALAAVLVALTGLAFGVLPALRTGRIDALAALRNSARAGGGRKERVRAVLVGTQVMASVVLLISSGLLVRAVWTLEGVDPGFRSEGVLTLRTALPSPRYDSTQRRAQFLERVLAQVRTLPGVRSAGYVSGLPMVMRGGIWPVVMTGAEAVRDEHNTAALRYVTPQYFAAMGIPVLRGRDVDDADRRDAPYVAVVSQSFARRYWPNADPIGRRFTFAFDERTIVGVVGDVRTRGLEPESEPQVYLPYRQVADGALTGYAPKDLVVRSTTSAASLVPALRRIVRSVDANQPISDVRALTEIVRDDTATRRAQLRVLAALTLVAVLLAGIGVHGLLAFTTTQRAPELGIRSALGASSGSLVRMVLREGVRLSLLGIVPGVWLAYLAARSMRALLAGVPPADPITIAAAVALCVATAVIGSLRPAMRAARADPMAALRAE
jgi:putative ABC transport system permease protein